MDLALSSMPSIRTVLDEVYLPPSCTGNRCRGSGPRCISSIFWCFISLLGGFESNSFLKDWGIILSERLSQITTRPAHCRRALRDIHVLCKPCFPSNGTVSLSHHNPFLE